VNFTSFEAYKYMVELSADKTTWETVIDRSTNTKIIQHEYTQLSAPVEARYARVTNTSNRSSFSQSDFRVFGNAPGTLPDEVSSFSAERMDDDMGATISWSSSEGAHGYVVRYGIAPEKLYNCYEIRGGATSIEIRSLNADIDYYCTVDAFNDAGITKSGEVVIIQSLISTHILPPGAVSTHKIIGTRNISGVLNLLGRSVGEVNFQPHNQPGSPGLYIYRVDFDKSAALSSLYLRGRNPVRLITHP
jgi:hypothetical protein